MTTDVLPTIKDRYSDDDVARFYALGHWRDVTLWDAVEERSAKRPDDVFLTDGRQELTYRQLRERAESLALTLHEHGIGKGDRVVVQIPNWEEFGVCLVACSRAGAITVPIMTVYREDEVRYIVNHSGAKAVITTGEFRGFDYLAMYRQLRAECASVTTVVAVRAEAGQDEVSFEQAASRSVSAQAAAACRPAGPDDGHLIMYTSGTTSKPKGCFHTYNTVQFSARIMAAHLGWNEKDVAFGPSPVAHGTGYMTSILGPLLAGAASHLMDIWEPSDALVRIEKFGCTVTTTATPFLQMLVGAYDAKSHNVGTMRAWVAAGAPIPASVVEAGRRALQGCEILSLYGRSENFLTTMCGVGSPPDRSTTSDGRAPDGIEVAIVDAEGKPLPVGEVGDIAYRGPGHMLGYFRDEAQTEDLFTPDGFSRSGDLGYMDPDGYVRVTGRSKDIIIRGGMNISAREVEEHLLAHPAVENVAVVAMPDERLGERACAYVVLRSGQSFDFEEMSRFLKERETAAHKRPERLQIVDQLPMTATGKIQKHVLRADIERKLGAGVPSEAHASA